MCFSATASFTAGVLLVAIGTATVRKAGSGREAIYAAIPLLFGMQQLTEGVVWSTFDAGPVWLNVATTQLYSFFSHVLWPVYVPVAAWLLEPQESRRKVIAAIFAVGLGVGIFLLYSMVTAPIVARPIGRHIEYDSPHFYIAASVTAYLVATTASMLVSSRAWVKAFGALALISAVLSYYFYARWFISVWCFFAALLSVVVALHFLPRAAAFKRIPS